MANKRFHMASATARESVSVYARIPLSGTNGSGFARLGVTGSGIASCNLSGTTYTLVLDDSYSQLVNLDGTVITSPNFAGTSTGSLGISFNNSQLGQLTSSYTSTTSAQPTGSGQNQTIDFSLVYTNSGVTAPVLPAGSGSVFVSFTFLNQNYSLG